MTRQIVFAALLASACHRQPLRSVEAVAQCVSDTALGVAVAVGTAAWQPGRYRLVQVITTLPAGRAPYIWAEGSLDLAIPTPAQRSALARREIGYRPREDLRLLGHWTIPGWPSVDSAELDGDTLYLGCRDCLDGSPTRTIAIAAHGRRIWGTWRDPQDGIAIPMDPVSHEPLRETAGYFCAERRAP